MSIANTTNSEELDYILSAAGVRGSAAKIYEHAKLGNTHFTLDEAKLEGVADFVISVIHESYPSLDIPYHSRWRHFSVEGTQSLERYLSATRGLNDIERACVGVDLIVPSVLLDAGAGSDWVYKAPDSNVAIGRSEGLGLASIDMFLKGAFSADQENPLTSNASALSKLTVKDIEEHFQVNASNPMVGVQGRLELVRSLGEVIRKRPEIFPNGRPSDLVHHLIGKFGRTIEAKDVLGAVIQNFGDIWPGRTNYHEVNLGDVWHYSPFGDAPQSLISFHKLSQWLTYSIIETLQVNGIDVTKVNDLTGLAEYRNGGLFVDGGVITLTDPEDAKRVHLPSSELIIEWRALTIHLLDKLAKHIRVKLNMNDEQLPLVKILEGGTWLAGRKLAAKRCANSSAPILLDSDGTVF